MMLQKQRMRFNEYGAQLEAYWKVFPNTPGKDFVLEKAADSYRAAGNTAAELRVLQEAFEGHGLNGEPLRRYFDLLSKTSPGATRGNRGRGGGRPGARCRCNFGARDGESESGPRSHRRPRPSPAPRLDARLHRLLWASITPTLHPPSTRPISRLSIRAR